MTPERYKQVEEIFNAALDRDEGERASFLRQACGDDDSLRQEVETLLTAQLQATTFIETPAFNMAADKPAAEPVKPFVGRIVGPYHIISLLGAGGMGEIYLAHDTRLDRKIALKLLPAHFTDDQNRLHRFFREAKAASSLNHPNIITIHDIGQVDDIHFIATEFIEGHTLRHHIKNSRLKLTDALDTAVQIAGALAAAHAAGIVHRDIKPENVMVRPDRLVKVLDFGIAKLTENQTKRGDTKTPTAIGLSTLPGLVIGTPQYMSPEQARGQKVDARTDIFSLGVLVYEMIVGRPPFEGGTVSDVIAAILTVDPPPLSIRQDEVPDELEQIITKALAKEREQRYQTIKEFWIDLKSVREGLEFQARLRSTPPGLSIAADAASRQESDTHALKGDQDDQRTIDLAGISILSRAKQSTGESGLSTIEETAHTQQVEADKTTAKEQEAPPVAASTLSLNARWGGRKIFALLALLAVAVGLAFYLWLFGKLESAHTGASIRSLAVLPFKTMSGTDADEYLGLSMADALITRLGSIKQIGTRPTSAVLKYSGADHDPRVTGRDLGVEAVLEGSIRRSGERIRITVQLVNVESGAQIWADTFDDKVSDLFTLEDRVSARLAEALTLNLTGEEKTRLTRRYTQNIDAYSAYLKGRFHWNQRNPEGIKKAIDYFNQAITIDPNFALAYVGLADCYGLLGFRTYSSMPTHETMPKAKIAAMKALEIDETLAEAHASLGLVKFRYDYDWPGAEAEFKRALDLNPSYSTAHLWYADLLFVQGRRDESAAQMKLARDADQSALIINSASSLHTYYERRYDQAIEQCRKILDKSSDFYVAHLIMALAYTQKQKYEEALAEIEKAAPVLTGGTGESNIGHIYAVMGRKADALKMIERLKELSKQSYVSPIHIALVYAGLGDADLTMEWLERAYDHRHPGMVYLSADPKYDWLRSDARFIDLLRRIGSKT